ncbi:glycerophosphodiester phosphodiesterase GDPDL3-like [Phragmites australis]|uniref:glycerophosphodiester phosphodiesterase GDPDL3-like n=1 Tax=Phragmites australis TaxID=29695 RepID=UPI002D78EE6D|nr:glycerophosphodiester phosphodiesterase GDPDL3-like [Phragmites australis]
MRGSNVCSVLPSLVLLWVGVAAAQKASSWKTLSGDAPAIIAKGGFSGLFPDSSEYAYRFALIASSPDTILYCDVRLTKDGLGICLPDIKMENCTNIPDFYAQGKKSYLVNGVPMTGWFSVDYNGTELGQVSLKQSIYSRTPRFDPSFFPILAVEDVQSKFKPPGIWLNVQHDSFYSQFNLSMMNYIISVSKRVVANYISSPEVSFLTSILGRVSNKTNLVFRFLDETTLEPSTNRTYGSMLKNLTFVKTFASGILVPKHYIWPVSPDNYLQPYTSVVDDAHKAGLEIYAADFANDFTLSYNHSYDPLAEYLSFIDNGAFSVDGVLTDFPVTPSEAIGCFTNLNKSISDHGKPLIISHNGASGDYPGCTDLAYQKAVDNGADVIDCPVQVTKDGIPICMSSINLMDDTTVARSQFASQTAVIKDIQSVLGVFTFNLTWDDIVKNLRPKISTPFISFKLDRNPRYRNAGNFMRLSDFLDFTKDKDISGIMISVEHAAFVAAELGFDMVDAVVKALDIAGYNNQTTQKVMIQSTNSSVLVKFKQQTKYDIVYMVDEEVRDAAPSSLADIKKFADAVSVDTSSIFPESRHFTTYQTDLVQSLQTAGLSVYVYTLMNEFVAQPYDFFSDATAQINAYVKGAGVDGIITDFPATARRYKLNTCMNMGNNTPSFMAPAHPGDLLQLISKPAQPPALAPMPLLTGSDVAEPPLPPARTNNGTAPAHSRASRTHALTTHIPILVTLAMLCACRPLF